MNKEQFKKELSELLDTLPRPEFGINCISINISESAYKEFNRLREELREKFIKDKDEKFQKEKQDLLDKINPYEDFQKQKFKEQEEIRDNYYKLLTLENNKSKM